MALQIPSIPIPVKFFTDDNLREYFQEIMNSLDNLDLRSFELDLLTISTTKTLTESDVRRPIWVDTTCTLTIPKGLTGNGKIIPIYTDSGVTLTLSVASEATLNYFQGGSNSTGSRTIAQFSEIRLLQETTTSYVVTGIGIT